MCVIFFYANSNPTPDGFKLILASNRDEFYARKTCTVANWRNAEHVYGGIDLEPGREGGTWLAIGVKDCVFKIGALLNLTGEPKPRNAVGRGMIVSNYVTSTKDQNIENYNKHLKAECHKYSAFNFASIEIRSNTEPAHISVLSNAPTLLENYEEGKCYGFGNSLPDTPFEKVVHGQKIFQGIVEQHNSQKISNKHLINNLLYMLKDKTKYWPDHELNRRAPKWGESLSAINVFLPEYGYGSRTHSVILVDSQNKLDFYEETMTTLSPTDKWKCTHIVKKYSF